MSKQVYISAGYAPNDGDQEVIDELHTWGSDNKHKTNFIDTTQAASGSMSDGDDCRYCQYSHAWEHPFSRLRALLDRCILNLESTHYI